MTLTIWIYSIFIRLAVIACQICEIAKFRENSNL